MNWLAVIAVGLILSRFNYLYLSFNFLCSSVSHFFMHIICPLFSLFFQLVFLCLMLFIFDFVNCSVNWTVHVWPCYDLFLLVVFQLFLCCLIVSLYDHVLHFMPVHRPLFLPSYLHRRSLLSPTWLIFLVLPLFDTISYFLLVSFSVQSLLVCSLFWFTVSFGVQSLSVCSLFMFICAFSRRWSLKVKWLRNWESTCCWLFLGIM